MSRSEQTSPTSSDRPTGEYFTEIYRLPGPPVVDSARARRRFGHYILNTAEIREYSLAIASLAELRYGHGPRYIGTNYHMWVEYLEQLAPDDFLDFPTLVVRSLQQEADKLNSAYSYRKGQIVQIAAAWIGFVRAVFAQENLAFEIDLRGGIHPKVDSEFQRAKQEIIRGLNAPDHARVKQCVEDAYKHFDDGDHKQSIWSIFEAVETLFQGLVGDRLNRGSIENKLRPLLVAKFSSDEEKTWDSIAKSLSDWTDAFHQYRHGQPGSEPRVPSQTLCIFALSTGSSLVRVLLDLMAKTQSDAAS